LSHVSYRVGGAILLKDVSLTFRKNQFNVIVGPNGAGKSTLMRIASGLTRPTSGSVTYLGEDVSSIGNEALARKRAVLSQNVGLAFALTVEEVVLIGRFPHYGATPTRADREIVSQALEEVGIADRRKQAYPTLSGGEKQKVQLARVLAQIWATGNAESHRVLFLDEPVTGLDVHYQIHILDSAKAMLASDCTLIAVLHDLNLAFDYADSVFVIDNGSVVLETANAHGVPASVLEKVFDVSAEKVVVPGDGSPIWRFSRRPSSDEQ
ncbi:MAG: ATP-binding cassette domain-containing protein, partial [Thermoanaerobaculia bacterium]